ncbi:MAG: hypothetical protein ABEJ68_08200 [Halobacteriaceae archaeon]
MTAMETLRTVATVLQLVGLLSASALLTASLVRYRRQVLYPEGVGLIAGSLVLLTVAAVVEHVVLDDATGAVTYSYRLAYTGAAVGIALGTWQFARDFVRFPEEGEAVSIEPIESGGEGGFEDAR